MNPLEKVIAKGKLQLEKARVRFGWVDITFQTFKAFSEHDGGSYAAALTYYMFFSLFPILLFAAAFTGYLTAGNEELTARILNAGLSSVPLLRDVLTPDGLAKLQETRGSLALTGFAMALYSGTGAIVALGHALNRFYGVTEEPNWFVKRFRSLKFLVIFGAAAVVSIILGTITGFATNLLAPEQTVSGKEVRVVLTETEQMPGRAIIQVGGVEYNVTEGERFGNGYRLDQVDGECVSVAYGNDNARSCITSGGITFAGILATVLGHAVGFIVGVLLFASAFKFLPSLKLAWREVLPGAVIAAIAFELLKELGSFYLERGSRGRPLSAYSPSRPLFS